MNSNPRLISRLGYIIILIAVSLFAASNAFAESGSVKKVVQLSKAAMEDYDNFELEDADTKLIQAVQMVENLGVTDPGVANVYVAQGIVSFGRFKDSVVSIAEDRAYTAFLKALTLNPNVTIPDDYRSDELQKIFDKAKSDIETASHSTKIAVAAAAPSVEHTPIQYNNRCTPLRILASVPSHPDIYRTFVYYSVDGQFKSEALEMKPTLESADILEATIPALDTRGDKIVYYIEAQNRRGQVVANVSDANSPMVVTMEGECVGLTAEEKAQTYGDPLFQFSLLFGTAIGVIPDNSNTTCYYSGEAHNYYCNDSSRSGSNVIDQATMKRGVAILPFH
ncbi:MAG: hypothetical protein IJU23_11270, partial [Proteobacteria bacterium]|nr:hypothetical protein [Pseudomonadota bacterium]